ncbi:hypothetical protein JTB14_019709 [Gonioctena quinquepunctata]|nr:hypothetical protein JTB14_019709 [Gonioctena quinquepunctata]
MNLTEGFTGKTSVVAFYNFFAFVPLLEELHCKKIYAVGTVRTTRRGLPEMMKGKVSMNRGELQFKSKGVISAVKWQDSGSVTFLTTAVSSREITTVEKTNKDGSRSDVFCPKVVDL